MSGTGDTKELAQQVLALFKHYQQIETEAIKADPIARGEIVALVSPRRYEFIPMNRVGKVAVFNVHYFDMNLQQMLCGVDLENVNLIPLTALPLDYFRLEEDGRMHVRADIRNQGNVFSLEYSLGDIQIQRGKDKLITPLLYVKNCQNCISKLNLG